MHRMRSVLARRRTATLAVALLIAVSAVSTLRSSADAADQFTPKALDYLHARQNSDGGFAEKGGASSDALTAWTMAAIASAGEDCSAWKPGSASPVDYLSHQSAKWKTTADYARTVLAVVAAGKDPRSFGGVDLVARLRSDARDHGDAGDQLGPYVNSHVWAMIALKAAGQTPTAREAKWLLGEQNTDGGWGWAPGITSDTNDTAAAMQALAAAGQSASSPAMTAAVAYLRSRQHADGGFSYSGTAASDANSTAWVVQGLLAARQSPGSWSKSGHSPLSWLTKNQATDGSERYSATTSSNALLVTVQAIPALRGEPFPVTAPHSPATPQSWKPSVAPEWPASGATVSWSSTSTLRFHVSDGTGVGVNPDAVSVRVDGVGVKPVVAGAEVSVRLASVSSGAHAVKLVATDRAGNSSSVADWRFTVASSAAASAGPTVASSASATDVAGAVVPSQTATPAAAVSRTAVPTESVAGKAVADRASQARQVGLVAAVIGSLLAVALLGAIMIVSHRRRHS
jgi:hypothetical protein